MLGSPKVWIGSTTDGVSKPIVCAAASRAPRAPAARAANASSVLDGLGSVRATLPRRFGRCAGSRSQRIDAPLIARAITRRWISEVPSKIV